MFVHKKLNLLKNFKLIISGACLTLLIGCGFALRGNIDIPIEAQTVWLEIQDNNSNLDRSFKALAAQNNLILDEFADYRIVVTDVDFRRITTTVTSDDDVDEYTLRGEISFDIVTKDDEIVSEGLEGFSERTFQYDANDASASNSREAFLSTEIRQDLSAQILRQYSAYFRLK